MSGTDIICTRWFHSSSGTSSQNAFRTPSSFATSLNTCQMSSFPLIPLKVFLRWNRQLCATTSLKVSPYKHSHTDSTLAITASTFCLIFLFLYAEPNFPFNNEEIDDTDPTDCEESSQELEEDVWTWSRKISNFGARGFVFVEWSILAGFPESCFLKIIYPLSILGEFLLHHFWNLCCTNAA